MKFFFLITIFYSNLKNKYKKPSCITQAHFGVLYILKFLHSEGLVCLANLEGSCLHSGGSGRPGAPSLEREMYPPEIWKRGFWFFAFIFGTPTLDIVKTTQNFKSMTI